jgi:hypothetical protein
MMEIVLHEMPLILAVTEMNHNLFDHIDGIRLIRIDIHYLIAGPEDIVPVIGGRLICSCTLQYEAWILYAGNEIAFAVPVIGSRVPGRLKVHLIRAEQVPKLLYQKIRPSLHCMALPETGSDGDTAL